MDIPLIEMTCVPVSFSRITAFRICLSDDHVTIDAQSGHTGLWQTMLSARCEQFENMIRRLLPTNSIDSQTSGSQITAGRNNGSSASQTS